MYSRFFNRWIAKQQRVIPNGQSSNWENVRMGVPKGSV